jgi:hypothetical protein
MAELLKDLKFTFRVPHVAKQKLLAEKCFTSEQDDSLCAELFFLRHHLGTSELQEYVWRKQNHNLNPKRILNRKQGRRNAGEPIQARNN